MITLIPHKSGDERASKGFRETTKLLDRRDWAKYSSSRMDNLHNTNQESSPRNRGLTRIADLVGLIGELHSTGKITPIERNDLLIDILERVWQEPIPMVAGSASAHSSHHINAIADHLYSAAIKKITQAHPDISISQSPVRQV